MGMMDNVRKAGAALTASAVVAVGGFGPAHAADPVTEAVHAGKKFSHPGTYGTVCTNADGSHSYFNRKESDASKVLTKHPDTCVDARALLPDEKYNLENLTKLKNDIRRENAARRAAKHPAP